MTCLDYSQLVMLAGVFFCIRQTPCSQPIHSRFYIH